ncbi:T9SS type A sorting domain-containing protein [Saccharicrinis aurantiacus]|uniref:T9SS type A sorting domain-containing protein n=1 Tax=Saccharicrinis aurantiacus TaxID=1849719 RepID=UPI000838E744|nr:T9SS type A sorting domain-containing protein [Saccharicrinis aurantiacus]
MKIKHLLFVQVLLVLITSTLSAQVTLWSDDFETDKGWSLTGEFEIGIPLGGGDDDTDHAEGFPNPTSAYSGINVLSTDLDGGYANNLSDKEYKASSPIIDCSGYVNITLDFQRWLNLEQSSYDEGYIEYYNGIVWGEIWDNSSSGTIEENSWSNQIITLPADADDNSNVRVRFSLGSTDGSWYYSGWNIDDVKITGSLPPASGDYQSRDTKNWTARNTWQVYDGSGWNNTNDDPGKNGNAGVVSILNGNDITLNNDRGDSYAIENLSLVGNLYIGNNNNVRSLVITNSITGSGMVDMTKNSKAHNLTVGGDFIPGAFNAGSGNVYFNGGSSQKIGAFTYNNLELSGGGDKVIEGDVTINGVLNLNGAKLILGEHDLIIEDGASISGTFSSSNMIVSDGSGRLIKKGSSSADFQMVYPLGTGSVYSPFEISNINASGTGSISVGAVSGIAPGPPARDSKDLNKYWLIDESGLTITSADILFSYDNSEVGTGGNQASYIAQWYSGGVWQDLAGASVAGSNPMSVSDVTDLNGTWTAVETVSVKTYYSYRSGDWNTISTWTHDPGGTTQTATDVPGDDAKVVIVDGRNVTLTSDVNDANLKVVILAGGFLNAGAYSFTNQLTELSGEGTYQLSTDKFPIVTNNYFVSEVGGIVEYQNATDFDLPITQAEYNKLIINTSATATQLSDLHINGDLHIKGGIYQINDNSSALRSLEVIGNLQVDAGASMTVGTGNTISSDVVGGTAPFIDYYDKNTHRIVLNGDLINNGTIRFTNQSYPEYNAFTSTGAATVYFMGTSDNVLTCNSTTDFYNIVLDKGSDQTYKLSVYSSSYSNFRLYGRNDHGGETGGDNPNLRKALWLRSGTMVLQGLTVIPSLTEGGGPTESGAPNSDFYIPVNAALVLDGPDVVVLTTADDYAEVNAAYAIAAGSGTVNGVSKGSNAESFSIYGKLQINDGYLSARESGGIITWDIASAEFIINGGTVDIKQFRSGSASAGLASYTQNGGEVNFRGRFQRQSSSVSAVIDLVTASIITSYSTQGLDSDKAILSVDNPLNVYNVSGGTMKVYDGGSNGYAIDVFSEEKNINVTGGELQILAKSNSSNFRIRTAAQLGSLLINRDSGSTSEVTLSSSTPEVSGHISVINDINILSGVLNANNYDVALGGDFSIASGTTYTTGSNRTIFDGDASQTFTVDLANEFQLNKLVIDKSADELLLQGTQGVFNVNDSLIIKSGDLNCDTKNVKAQSNVYIGGNQLGNGSGGISIVGSSPQVIDGNGLGEVYYLKLNTANTTTLKSDLTVTGTLQFVQGELFDIGVNNLTFSDVAQVTGESTDGYIKTSGNVGDGGVTFTYSSNTAKLFPIGVDSYTPASIGFSSTPTSYGSVTIIPVNYQHSTVDLSNSSLDYFWRVKSSGFSDISGKVEHQFVYDQNDVQGTENNYVSARYDVASYDWSIGSTADVDNSSNTINDWTGSADFIDGDYTAGLSSAFATPQKYYSKQSGDWNQSNTWSNSSHTGASASSIPSSGDVVIIGNGHTVSLERYSTSANRDAQSCASLQIEAGGVLDATYNPGSDFGMVMSHSSGNGKIRISVSDSDESIFEFPNGDFSDFNANLGTTELYTNNSTSGTTYWLPDGVMEYGNLMISPLGGSNIIFPNNDVVIIGDLIAKGQSSESWYCPTWNSDYPSGFDNRSRQAKDITIKGNFDLQGGALIYYGNNDLAQNFIIEGDLVIAEDAGISVYSNATNQSITIGGDLINDARSSGSGSDSYRGSDFDKLPLIFNGDGNSKITQSSGTSYTTYINIESIKVDKGDSNATTLTMDIDGTVDYESDEWLQLVNGTFIYERNANVSINTNTSFSIPSTSGLTVNSNDVVSICTGSSDDYDVYLDGKLTLMAGTLNIGNSNNNNNNDVEYSGSGLSEIEIQSGSLFVNGQVRRNSASTSGILNYKQTGGSLTVNGRNALATNAKFEILNAGSSFEMSAGTIEIVRGAGTTYGDVYLRPENSTVTGGEIVFNNNGNGAQDYLLDADIALYNLTVEGTGNVATTQLLISPLVLNGDLKLSNTNSVFDANSSLNIPVTINGDFINSGSYLFHENTTSFNGSSQIISGSASIGFYNLIVNPVTSLSMDDDINVSKDLTIESGTLAVNGNTINVQGNVVNKSTYTSSGNGLVLNGSSVQSLSGTGTFDKLELDNASGATLLNDLSIQGDLVLTRGVLDIKDHLLSLGLSSSVSGTFDANTMITTNGVYSNKGVEKIIPSGASVFTFPIGTSGKYTPTVLTTTTNGNSASIKVHPINTEHPANIDPTNLLNYYWAVESTGLTSYNGKLEFYYDELDVNGAETSYYAARLLVPGTSWSKTNSVDDINNVVSFTLMEDNISGEYTAGLDSAFPNNVPEYTSQKDGSWSDPSVWVQTSGDSYVLSGAPNGFLIKVENEVELNENYAQAYKINISSVGKLKILNTNYGHNLGEVSGEGILYLEDGQIPEGAYDGFLGCGNSSTLEYGGTGDYTIVADLYSNATNLIFSGSGTRVLPNKDLTICDQFLIDGPIVDNSVYNKTLYIKGSFEKNSGSFNSGTGSNATISFIGSVEQSISGFSGSSNSLNNLEINNSAGLTLGSDIEILGNLLLTNGNINTSSANALVINNTSPNCILPTGGSVSSFVNGPLTKMLNQSDGFVFPVGDEGMLGDKLKISSTRTGTRYWTVTYHRPNSNYSNFSFPLTAVNSHEYWTVSTPGGGEAKVELSWDASSDITPIMTEHGLDDLRVVNYDGSNWQEVASGASGSDTSGTVVSDDRQSVSDAGTSFTTATVNTNKPKARLNPSGAVCGNAGIPIEITTTVPAPFDYLISYTIDGVSQAAVTISSLPYSLPTPVAGEYELTAYTYDGGSSVGVVDATPVSVYDSPTVSNAGPDQSLQGLSAATMAANDPTVGTGAWVIVSGTGGSFDDPTINNTVFNGTNGSSYVLRWTISNGDCESVSEVNIAFPLLPPHTWQGDVDNDWFNADNWTDGIVPNSTTDVTINAGSSYDAVIDGGLALSNDVTIVSGTLTVKPGAQFSVSGDMVTNNSFIIENTDVKPASVITMGTISGNSTVKWGLEDRQYWYIAHSISDVEMSDYNSTLYVGSNDYFLYRYSDAWVDISKTSYSFTDVLEGLSLIIKDPNSVLEYSGQLNNSSSYNKTLSEDSYHLIANPYPSYIDVSVLGAVDFGDASPTIYVRTDIGTDVRGFATYHTVTGASLNGGSNIIAPGQSVWVKSGISSDFVINSSARIHSTYSLKGGSEPNYIKVGLESEYAKDEMAIAIHSMGTSFYTNIDAPKKFGTDNAINLYSLKGTSKTVVSVYDKFEDQQRIPLAYSVENEGMSEFEFSFTSVSQVAEGFDVILIDKELGEEIDLSTNNKYKFTPTVNASEDRFELYFKQSISTDIKIDENNDLLPNIYTANEKCYFSIPSELVAKANGNIYFEIFDMKGSLVVADDIQNTKHNCLIPSGQGVYVVRLNIGGDIFSEKVIIR